MSRLNEFLSIKKGNKVVGTENTYCFTKDKEYIVEYIIDVADEEELELGSGRIIGISDDGGYEWEVGQHYYENNFKLI
jgi:hypothetical protein